MTTPEPSPLLPSKPTRRHVHDAGEHARDDVRGARAASVARRRGGAARSARTVCTTVDRLLRAVAAAGRGQPERRGCDERRAPHGSRWTHSSESAPAASAKSAASPSEGEAQLAPLLRLAEPRCEVLVDGLEARLAARREELASRRLRDLPQRRRDRAARDARRPPKLSVPPGVPSAIVYTGMPYDFARAAPSSGASVPRVWAPSDSRRIADGGASGSTGRRRRRSRRLGAVAVGDRERLEQLDRARERVADRGAPAERRAELERLEHELAVVRERRGDERLATRT